MTLIAVGDMADKLVGWSGFTYTLDGKIWSTPVKPFGDRCRAVGIARSPDVFVAISDSGYVGSSPDGEVWQDYRIVEGNLSPQCIEYANNRFVMCGQRKFISAEGPYSELDEAAQLLINQTGENWNWQLIYSQDGNNSRFYNIRYISDSPIPTWVALGSRDNLPFGIYSIDNGTTWSEIKFPDLDILFAAYDIVWNIDRFYITVNGMVLNIEELDTENWGASQIFNVKYGSTDLIKIKKNQFNHMVAVCSGGIFYSLDQVGWTLFSPPGYRFKSALWYEDRWVCGADSNLTTYTYWTSLDTINWTAHYQPVQAYDLIEV